MQWDRLFDDLEGQLASEWEAERAALAAESERLRISRLELRTRLRRLCRSGAEATVELTGGRRLPVTLQALGADWVAASSRAAGGGDRERGTLLIPLHALAGIALDHGRILASLDETPAEPTPLRERMSLGFVLRDLARRRLPVHLGTTALEDLHGTIDRAAADHVDLALHDAGEPRRTSAVHGFRVIPFAAVACVRAPVDQTP